MPSPWVVASRLVSRDECNQDPSTIARGVTLNGFFKAFSIRPLVLLLDNRKINLAAADDDADQGLVISARSLHGVM